MPGSRRPVHMKLKNFVEGNDEKIVKKVATAHAILNAEEKLRGAAAANREGRPRPGVPIQNIPYKRQKGRAAGISFPQHILREKYRETINARKRANAEAAKAKGSRSGSGTRKSPHSRPGNVRLTFRNDSGKVVTKAIRNITDEDEGYLTSDQMDKLRLYHIDQIMGFRK
jgi:hypothetical protein